MSRSLRFTPAAWDDYLYWQGQGNQPLMRIHALVAADDFNLDVIACRGHYD